MKANQRRVRRAIAGKTPAGLVSLIETAIKDLRRARYGLREAGACNAADYVARALKSAEGAQRHARRRA